MGKIINRKAIKKFEYPGLIYNFRFRVVTLVVIIVAVTGYLAFQLFTHRLEKQLKVCSVDNFNVVMDLLREDYIFEMQQNGKKAIYSVIDKLENNPLILDIQVLNDEGKIVYSKNKETDNPLSSLEEIKNNPEFSFEEFQKNDSSYFRGIIPVYNKPNCSNCHQKDKKLLGYLLVDFSNNKIKYNISNVKTFGKFYTFSLILVLLLIVGFLHYRYIKKALQEFNHTFMAIKKGDLTKRVNIPEKDELGVLAKNFNQTLDKLQEYQNTIEELHRKEMMNAQKLATVGEMAASFAHEIKNPLTGIVNALNIVLEESEDSEKQLILKEIQHQSMRVTKAINELLQYSKPIKLHKNENDINKLLLQVHRVLQTQTEGKNIEFKLRLDPDIPLFKFDYSQIETVLMNLGINAIQAINKNGTIILESSFIEKENKVQIKIEDSGSGIEKEYLEKIFRPFFTTKHQGTGLGLAIANDIVERHEGRITVESERGKGTTFTIYLPVN